MKHPIHLPLLLSVSGLMLFGNFQNAHAQREGPSREDRRQERRDATANMTPEERSSFWRSRMDARMKSMTPEQRQRIQERINQRLQESGVDTNDPEAVQKAMSGMMNGQGGGRGNRSERAQSEAMKEMMIAAGITDFDTQDAIVAYVAEQNKARATLFQLAQKAATALQTPTVVAINASADATAATAGADSDVATTFSAYETAVKAENDRQIEALKALDAKINYSGTPRIKAFLTLVGILNNDVLAIGGPAAIFPFNQNEGMMNAGMEGRGGRGNRGNREQ